MERDWTAVLAAPSMTSKAEAMHWVETHPVVCQNGRALLVRYLDGMMGLGNLLGDLMSSQNVDVTSCIPATELEVIDHELQCYITNHTVGHAIVCISEPKGEHIPGSGIVGG